MAKKRKNHGAKGSEFERLVCGDLSRWYTNGKNDAVFWRTAGSGARARVRGRAGKATDGQHGDIGAIDPIGKPLIDLLAIELKRGYNHISPYDVADRQGEFSMQEWEVWLQKCEEMRVHAQAHSWMLITCRIRRCRWVWFPMSLLDDLRDVGAFASRPRPYVSFAAQVRDSAWVPTWYHVYGTTWENWTTGVRPEHIRHLSMIT